MKKSCKLLILLCATALLSGCSSSNNNNPHHEPTLDSLSLSGTYQTTFTVNDDFNHDGLIVTAHYSDESFITLNEQDYQVSTPDMSETGTKEVFVTYKTIDTSYNITINPVIPPEVTLNSISLSGTYQTTFTVGDTFTYIGLVVTAHYSDGSSLTVTPTSVTDPDMTSSGTKDVLVTYKTASIKYQITVNPEQEEDYEGYIHLDYYSVEIDIVKNPKKTIYLNPKVIVKGETDKTKTTFNCVTDNSSLIKVSQLGGTINPLTSSGYQSTGTCTVTVTCEEAPGLTAKCKVKLDRNIPEKVKVWNQVRDYDSLKAGDILVMAAPSYGVTASLDTLHSKLQPVQSTFSDDLMQITNLGKDTIEFCLNFEEKDDETYATLESQTEQYLVCTNEKKVKLDDGKNMNRYWEISSNVNPETGDENIDDGALIWSSQYSFGFFMYNVKENYFTTYLNDSILVSLLELPFLYRLEELNQGKTL